MKRTAIISAAGWKGAGGMQGLTDCPECFLPLGNGETATSRLAKHLSALDFDVIIGVGELGYPLREYTRRYQNVAPGEEPRSIDPLLEKWGLSPSDSPWTQERLDLAAEWGTVMQMPDPGIGNSHDTTCIIMDRIGIENWDGLLVVAGDSLFPATLLSEIVGLRPSFQYQICPNHSIFLFDTDGAAYYREYCKQPDMRKAIATMGEWRRISGRLPNGHPRGAGILHSEGGIRKLGPHNAPGGELKFCEIDTPLGYAVAQRVIADGSIDVQREKGEPLDGWHEKRN